MQVILLENIRNLGVAGDTVSVKNGYARNYLIPREKCMRASKENIAYFEQKKADIEAANADKKQAAEAFAAKLEGKIVTLICAASEDGRLFGSVSARDVRDELAKNVQEDIYRNAVKLQQPIKYIGVHSCAVELYADVSVDINAVIARSADEANTLLAQYREEREKAEKAASAPAEGGQPEATPAKEDTAPDGEEA